MKLKLGTMANMIVHYVGNKYLEEGVSFSYKETDYTIIEDELKETINKTFEQNDLYQFYDEPDLNMNHVYSFIKNIFKDRSSFIQQSHYLARALYEQSYIPQIKGGELCVLFVENCDFADQKTNAIVLLKVEKKESVVQYVKDADGFKIEKSEGINLSRIDKGCVIFDVDEESGYKLAIVDNNCTRQTAIYWKDNFLHVKSCNGAFHQTKQLMNAIKDYVSENMSEDKVSKAVTLSRSKKLLCESESIDVESFAEDIFENTENVGDFIDFLQKKNGEYYDISQEPIHIEKSLAKPKKALPTVTIHLDKNFDVKIFGGEGLISQGYDEEIGMNFYTLYYVNEK